MSIDAKLAAAASAKGQTLLADTLQCKVSAALELIDQVRQDSFFEEMAKHGHVPSTEDEAAQMVAFANNASQWVQAEQTKAAGSRANVFKVANETLSRSLGNGAAEAQRARAREFDDIRSKASHLALVPGIAEHVLSLIDAESLLGE
jgi:hypothetical protein